VTTQSELLERGIALVRILERSKLVNPETHYHVDANTDDVELHIFQCGDYMNARALLREAGIGSVAKSVHPTYTALHADYQGVKVWAYSAGLPPTCRLTTVMKKVPKTQTVECGEFIEVPETKVECGELGKDDADENQTVELPELRPARTIEQERQGLSKSQSEADRDETPMAQLPRQEP